VSDAAQRDAVRGTWIAAATFVLWGVMPLYWHVLKAVPSLQIVLHRIAWSAVFVGAFLFWRDGRGWLRAALAQPRLRGMLAMSGLLIAFNWGLYIWAVNAGHVVESALGYFINPLLSVLIGVVFLRERLRALQWLSVALATAGVLWLTFQHGRLPWIALALAGSFALYGLIRKLVAVDSITGLGVESAYLLLPALALLAWSGSHEGGFPTRFDALENAMLVLSGIVTALPLVGFAYAVRRIPLSSVGLMQYIAPTLQFLIGVFVLHETLDQARLLGFVLIWIALAVFAGEGLWRARRERALPHTA
jgi:chloramphenicol-sensitive protein RarD